LFHQALAPRKLQHIPSRIIYLYLTTLLSLIPSNNTLRIVTKTKWGTTHAYVIPRVRAGLWVNFRMGMLHLSKQNSGKHSFSWIWIKGAAQHLLQSYFKEKWWSDLHLTTTPLLTTLFYDSSGLLFRHVCPWIITENIVKYYSW
jgi:hypothetical protein